MYTALCRTSQCVRGPLVSYLRQFSIENGNRIVPFSQEHLPEVKKIAFANMQRLAGDVWSDPGDMFDGLISPNLTKEHCLVSLNKGKPVAFITYGSVQNMITLGTRFGLIHQLATDVEFRQRNHAKNLMSGALERFREEKINYVALVINHLPLIPFYRPFGFKSAVTMQTKTNTYSRLVAIIDPEDTRISAFVLNRLIITAVPIVEFSVTLFQNGGWLFIVPYVVCKLDIHTLFI